MTWENVSTRLAMHATDDSAESAQADTNGSTKPEAVYDVATIRRSSEGDDTRVDLYTGATAIEEPVEILMKENF